VRERDREPRAEPARRLEPELIAQPLERRIEWVERRRGRLEAPVRVAGAVPLLEPRESGERLLQQLGRRVSDVDVAAAHRIEHPAGAVLGKAHRPTARSA